jgi:FkbM family methyltransferase
MQNLTVLKDNKWVWPANDESSWEGQQSQKDLYMHLLPYVKNKNVMIQAGGNCGFVLDGFTKHFNNIYTFEPDPVNFYCLNRNITSHNIIKIQGCLGNSPYPVSIQHLSREGRAFDIGGVHVSGSGFTPVFRIDDLNLPDCNLIQLDIEGYEFEALSGAIETIKKFKPVICVEMHDGWLNRYDSSSEKIESLLESLDYKFLSTYHADKIFLPK